MPTPVIIFIIFIIVVIAICIANIRIVPQAQAFIIERLGTYYKTWHTGIHFTLPFFDKIRAKISLMEKIADFAPQDVITKDNVKMRIDTVVFYQITDCKLYTYGVEHPKVAIENLTATTLRNIIGELELDNTLTSRDIINTRMRTTLDEATDPWGIKVNRVELKNIIPPKEIQDAMEKQMKAERERREKILIAEGSKAADILTAEGKKQAMILGAEAEKQKQILLAEAEKEAKIRQSEGEAAAILAIQKATADGIRLVNEAAPSREVIAIKSLEAFEKAADGKATKIIIPSEIQSLAGLTASLREIGAAESAEKAE
jgi:regulator of protease activity HflC (stomatin/prohibitin superfamily)